ncbi:MAG: hypothetical protein R3346_03515 [Candidatus Spechtbacterales bacterium]|nr:hypothetical protein [Candidatus Spechtbacterales bacterium]
MSVFSQIISIIGTLLFQVIKATWWIVLPVVFLFKIKNLITAKQRGEYAASLRWTTLEVILPEEVTKTPKAMENVLAGLHGVWHPKMKNKPLPDVFSLEMAGIEGELHFYVRCRADYRNFVESKIFAQYPNVSIKEVEDYTSRMDASLLRKNHDFWGADYALTRDSAYPIKGWDDFEDMEEERRMDPLSQLAELAAKLEKGEQIWLQIVISPVLSEVEGKAERTRDQLIGRSAPQQGLGLGKELSKVFSEMIDLLISGNPPGALSGGGEDSKSENKRLTPGEEFSIKKIEEKAQKPRFNTMIRALYIAENEVMHKEHIAGLHGFFRQFTGMNDIQPEQDSISDQNYWILEDARDYIHKKKLLGAYKNRALRFVASPYAMSTEEIATLYHYPGRVVQAPFMPRTPGKTSEPPRGLPT